MARNNEREYRIWKNMKSRCYSPTNKMKSYQSNGIIVCDRWKDSYENFLEDMGRCPENYSLERKNNNGNYELSNCIWADSFTQSKNRGSFNKLFTYNGETLVLKEWSRKLNIKYSTLYNRLYRAGFSFEEAIKEDPCNYLIEYKGKKHSLIEWHKITNIPYQVLVDRQRRDWTIERMFEQPIRKRN